MILNRSQCKEITKLITKLQMPLRPCRRERELLSPGWDIEFPQKVRFYLEPNDILAEYVINANQAGHFFATKVVIQ